MTIILIFIGVSVLVVSLNVLDAKTSKTLWDYTKDVRKPNQVYTIRELRMLAINKRRGVK